MDIYASEAPSPQLAVDIFAGEWSSRFPPGSDIDGGQAELFEDRRISWMIDQLEGVEGLRILELGPLEGGHTYMLDRAGADVVAIEANQRAYLKCLITKEVLACNELASCMAISLLT